MPRLPARVPAWLLLATLAVLTLGAAAGPAFAVARSAGELSAPAIHEAAVPGDERCADVSPDPHTGQKVCDEPFFSSASILPIAGAVVVAGLLALVVGYLVLRRRASVPLPALDPSEWWKCPKCGATNVVGSPRCYQCGTWQR
jgi:ABC-type branched-subunit amino acid transport system permease subunit